MALRNSALTILTLAGLLQSAAAGAQTDRVVVSIDEFRLDRITGDSRHLILPVAVFDGTEFHPAWEWDRALGATSRRPFLLGNYRDVQVLHRGHRVGIVHVSDIYSEEFHCSAVIVGSGDYAADTVLPVSAVTGASRGRNNGRNFDYVTAAYLALSGTVDEMRPDGASFMSVVTDPDELARYARDVDTMAPRADLKPLGIDETDAYRFDNHDAVLVIRKRRTEGTIVGPGGSEIPGPLLTDIVVLRSGAVLPLPGSATQQDAFGKGANDRLIDAFELPNGKVYFLFQRHNYEVWQARLYELGASGAPDFLLEVELYGC
jgi:hypothetical protein